MIPTLFIFMCTIWFNNSQHYMTIIPEWKETIKLSTIISQDSSIIISKTFYSTIISSLYSYPFINSTLALQLILCLHAQTPLDWNNDNTKTTSESSCNRLVELRIYLECAYNNLKMNDVYLARMQVSDSFSWKCM